MKLMIVDDEEANVVILKSILQRAGYTQFTVLRDPRNVVERFTACRPDLLLLDLHMPHLDGFEVMAALKPLISEDEYFPILMLTADGRSQTKQEALSSGARDFLSKPFEAEEVRLRIRNLLEARRFHLKLREQNEGLEARVQERTRQLEETHIEMLIRLAKAAEYRDDETGEHVWRVSRTSWLLALELGLPQDQAEGLLRAARLHDVGKISIPDGILLKAGRLTLEEFEVVKTHAAVGAQLLSGGRSPLIKMAELIALTHHERWDGTGYPQGLAGEGIPIESRILAVADTFDAMTHDRAHRKAKGLPEAVAEIEAQSGRQFDPNVVEAFVRLYERGELITELVVA